MLRISSATLLGLRVRVDDLEELRRLRRPREDGVDVERLSARLLGESSVTWISLVLATASTTCAAAGRLLRLRRHR